MTLDDAYLRGSMAAILFVVRHSAFPNNYHFHLIYSPSDDHLEAAIAASFPYLHFHTIPFTDEAAVRGRISTSVRGALDKPLNYARSYLTRLLPACLHRVVYLDSDVIVVDDISKLYYSTTSESSVIAAPQLRCERMTKIAISNAPRLLDEIPRSGVSTGAAQVFVNLPQLDARNMGPGMSNEMVSASIMDRVGLHMQALEEGELIDEEPTNPMMVCGIQRKFQHAQEVVAAYAITDPLNDEGLMKCDGPVPVSILRGSSSLSNANPGESLVEHREVRHPVGMQPELERQMLAAAEAKGMAAGDVDGSNALHGTPMSVEMNQDDQELQQNPLGDKGE